MWEARVFPIDSTSLQNSVLWQADFRWRNQSGFCVTNVSNPFNDDFIHSKTWQGLPPNFTSISHSRIPSHSYIYIYKYISVVGLILVYPYVWINKNKSPQMENAASSQWVSRLYLVGHAWDWRAAAHLMSWEARPPHAPCHTTESNAYWARCLHACV
jgi:hypothetical protein